MNFPFNKMENNSLFTLNKINILKQKGIFFLIPFNGYFTDISPTFHYMYMYLFLGVTSFKSSLISRNEICISDYKYNNVYRLPRLKMFSFV